MAAAAVPLLPRVLPGSPEEDADGILNSSLAPAESSRSGSCTDLLTPPRVILATAAVVVVVWLCKHVKLAAALTLAADWCRAEGETGAVAFALLVAVLMMLPVPITPVLATVGAVLPFGRAMVVATGGRQLGGCISFFLSRHLFRSRFDAWLGAKQSLRTVRLACAKEQWKITFLSRFSPLPLQVKNYCWGLLPVTFQCFFWCCLWADLLHTFCGVYVGWLGSHLAGAGQAAMEGGDHGGASASDPATQMIYGVGFVVTIGAMVAATLVARRIHLEALQPAPGHSDPAATRSSGLPHSHSTVTAQHPDSDCGPIIHTIRASTPRGD